jgi:2-polyprenyl-3-methyl-5-hydroxy-6-metoxy-1,4-benzoquinol methylase
MAQITSGVRRILDDSRVYDALQAMLGVRAVYRRIVAEHLQLRPGERLLDIGCGPAAIVDVLPDGVEYDGFDVSEQYIETARRRHGERGRFWAQRVSAATVAQLPPFDGVLAFGVLHHLDDDEAAQLCDLAWQALRPGGRLVTYDPCFHDGQSPIARFLVRRDRGQNVRWPDGYETIVRRRFPDVRRTIFTGHLRIPYTATVLTATKPASP